MYRIISASCCLLVISVATIYGQRAVDSNLLKRNWMWPTDSTVAYRYQFQRLASVPPIYTTTPWQHAVEYLVVDSVCRTYTAKQIKDSVLGAAVGFDSLCFLYRTIYSLYSYNPAVMRQYELETRYDEVGNINILANGDTVATTTGRYKCSISDFRSIVIERFDHDYQSDTLRRAMKAALFSDVIVMGSVMQIDSQRIAGTGYDSVPTEYYYRVRLCLLDSLKGLAGVPSYHVTANGTQSSGGDQSYIDIDYSTATYRPGSYSNIDVDFPIADTSLLNTESRLALEPQDTVVVFLRFQSFMYDVDKDYFRLSIAPDRSLGVMKIQNGKIFDPNGIWGLGMLPYSYAVWRSKFDNVVSGIMHCE